VERDDLAGIPSGQPGVYLYPIPSGQADPLDIALSDVVFRYHVHNTGDVPLFEVTVDDAVDGGADAPVPWRCSSDGTWTGCFGGTVPLTSLAPDGDAYWWSAVNVPPTSGTMVLVYNVDDDWDHDGVVGFWLDFTGALGPVTVDWGDGGIAEPLAPGVGPRTHHYVAESGVYGRRLVTINGNFEHFGTSMEYLMSQMPPGSSNPADVIETAAFAGLIGALEAVTYWSDTLTSSAAFAFMGALSLTSVVPPPSTVTDMSGMFGFASSFNQADLVDWDVSQVSNMYAMFAFASLFNQDLSCWDVSGLAVAPEMFNTGNLAGWPANSGWQPRWGAMPNTGCPVTP